MTDAAAGRTVQVRNDEADYLSESGRCKACGHLEALHNKHCCTFCMVPECTCEWGRLGGYTEDDYA